MRRFGILAGMSVLMLAGVGTAVASASTSRKLPPPAQVDCGNSGVVGAGFTVYACSSGGGGTKYAHWPEMLVVLSDGSYKGYRDAFSQADLVRTMANGDVIASHNDEVVRVTASALRTLVSERRLRHVPGSRRMGSIDALAVDSPGDIFLRANYYARNLDGCENARWELTAAGRLKLLWRSKRGLTCG